VEQGRAAVPHIRAAVLAPAESRSFPANVPQSRTNAARHAPIETCRAAEVIDVVSGLGRNRTADTRIFRSCATWACRDALQRGTANLGTRGPSVEGSGVPQSACDDYAYVAIRVLSLRQR
jgi:hypothetical protein